MELTSLLLPWLCVAGVTMFYGLLVRWWFRRRLALRLVVLAFLLTAGLVCLCVVLMLQSGIRNSLGPLLLGDLQAATDFSRMFRLAVIYFGLPEEAAKIGMVILLLFIAPRWQKHRSDPAEMLLYAALGFAMCESMLYVAGFAAIPSVREHLFMIAAIRGALGGLLHLLLGMIAGFLLAWRWQSRQRWLWVVGAYILAVLLHAGFDGGLLHLAFRSMQNQTGDIVAAVLSSALPVVISGLVLLVVAIVGLIGSRRLTNQPLAPITSQAAAPRS